MQVIVAAMNWVERRLLGLMQARLGPNRVGYKRPAADRRRPDQVSPEGRHRSLELGEDRLLPRPDPAAASGVRRLLPDSRTDRRPTFTIARSNVGVLLILALTSTAVYGIILGGWASNNKYSLMGGLRSAAQMVSYEVPFGLSIVGVLMISGSLDLVTIVRYQEANAWNFFAQIVACFIFFVSMNAENNRTPFDLPEAESELVAGYHTEYSAMKFAFFMLSEYSMMIVNSCLIVTLFFGGWSLGMFGLGLTTERLQSMGPMGGLLGGVIFFAKVMIFMLDLHLVPCDVPALPFRSAHGPRLEVDDPAGAGATSSSPRIFILRRTGTADVLDRRSSSSHSPRSISFRKPEKKRAPAAPGKVIHAS